MYDRQHCLAASSVLLRDVRMLLLCHIRAQGSRLYIGSGGFGYLAHEERRCFVPAYPTRRTDADRALMHLPRAVVGHWEIERCVVHLVGSR